MPAWLWVFAACSGSTFQGGSSADQPEKKKTEVETAELGGASEGVDDELIPVDHPAMVSGAYLTCVSEGDDVAQCRVETDDGKVDLDGLNSSWKVIDEFNEDLNKPVFPQDPGEKWHIKAVVGKSNLARSRITVDLEKNGYKRHLESMVKAQEDQIISFQDYLDVLNIDLFTGGFGGPTGDKEPENPPSNPTVEQPAMQQLGVNEDFRVGDGSFVASANPDCSDLTLQTVKLSGRMVSVPLVVKESGTRIAVILDDVCGAVSPSTNIARVIDGSGKTVSSHGVSSGINNHTVSLPGFTANAGRYEIQIISNKKRNGDYDDYVVGSIRVLFDGPVTLGEASTK